MRRLLPTSRHSLIAMALFAVAVMARALTLSHLDAVADPDMSRVEGLYWLTGAVICGGWIVADRRCKKKTPPSVLAGLTVLAWPIGIPVYLFVTRSWWALSKLACAIAVLAASAAAASWAAEPRVAAAEQSRGIEPSSADAADGRPR